MVPVMTTLHTERLILRPLVERDAPAYAEMRYHPAVAQWLIGTTGEPQQAALRSIASFANLWEKDGHAPWGLFLKDGEREGRLIGHGGLRIIPEFAATEVLYALGSVTRPFLMPPGVPEARVKAVRAAFAAAIADKELQAEAKKMRADTVGHTGEEMQKIIADVFATPPAVVARLKQAMSGK